MSISDPRLFGRDPESGMEEYFHYDDVNGGFFIETRQNVAPLIEYNKALYNASEKSTRYGELAEVARIPNVVLMDLAKQQIVTPAGRILDDKKYRQFLNDPANQCFRTRRGRV